MTKGFSILLAGAALVAATGAQAAHSDFYLKLDGVDGESASIPVESWSFGACNAGQCTAGSSMHTIVSPRDPASGQASGKRTVATQNSQSLRESPTLQSAGKGRPAAGVRVAAGDLDGDGLADFAYAGTQAEISTLTLSFDPASPGVAKLCGGKHIPKATLTQRAETFELSDVAAACTADGGLTRVVITGGQMKHTKSGHVTLMK